LTLENLDDYILEFQNYKEGNYKFGKYWTNEQIQNEFLKGKIFVLKGGLRFDGWFVIIFSWIVLLASLGLSIASFIWNEILFQISLALFIAGITSSLLCSILFIKLRRFLVIGPLGVYYQKIINKGFFLWNKVVKIEGKIVTPELLTTAEVKVYLLNRRKKKFYSESYLNKEFSKKNEFKMFINLFYIYFKLGQNKIPQSSIQKTLSYSQLKEQIISSQTNKEISQLKTEELHPILPISDKKEEKSKINSNSQSTKFPPISELLRKSRSSIFMSESSQLKTEESQPTPSISDKREVKSKVTSYNCKFCGFKLTMKAGFCPECGMKLKLF